MIPCSRIAPLATLLVLASCAQKFTRLEGDAASVRKWKSAALVEVVVAPAQTPVFPLADAAMYTANMDKILDRIEGIHDSMVDPLTEQIGRNLSKAAGMDVLAGAKLTSGEAYAKAAVQDKPRETTSKSHPKLHITSGSKNLVDVSGKVFTDEFLDGNRPDSTELNTLAGALGVDGLVIGMVSAPTTNVGMFGIKGHRAARVALYFYDAQGKFLLKGWGQTEPQSGGASDAIHYSRTLGAADPLSGEIAGKVFQ